MQIHQILSNKGSISLAIAENQSASNSTVNALLTIGTVGQNVPVLVATMSLLMIMPDYTLNNKYL